MKGKSAYIVISIGAIFVIASGFRVFGYSVPSLVVALFSVIAALLSLSDVFEVTRLKKYVNYIQIMALVLFVIVMSIWLIPFFKLEGNWVQSVGDVFTIAGLGLVIGLFGLKEILDSSNSVQSDEEREDYRFKITKAEYDEMMKLNDIIERLKNLDNKVIPYNKVHNGWALFSDSLVEHWNNWKGPFYDGVNRKNYFRFVSALDSAAEKIGNVADPNFISSNSPKIDMWGEKIEITVQSISNGYIEKGKVIIKLQEAMSLWDEVKKEIVERYERERAAVVLK